MAKPTSNWRTTRSTTRPTASGVLGRGIKYAETATPDTEMSMGFAGRQRQDRLRVTRQTYVNT